MGSQLGADQKYYITRCEEKRSIQLTITVVGDDEEHIEERKSLIDDITKLLDDIMKVFMPATKERPSLLIPCSFCPILHISLDDTCSGKAIFCPNAYDKSLPQGYYSDLLQGRLTCPTAGAGNVESYFITICIISFIGVDRKLEVFTAYYYKLTLLNFEALRPHLVTAKIINHEENQIVRYTFESYKLANCVLEKIFISLGVGVSDVFDEFLLVLENCDDIVCIKLAEQMRRDLLSSTNGIALYTCC